MTEARMINADAVIEAIVKSQRSGGMSYDGHQLATRLVELMYAAGINTAVEGLPEPSEPHYVLRFMTQANGALGNEYGLVSVSAWNNGLSRAISERVCDINKQPLVVYPAPYPLSSSPAVAELGQLMTRLDEQADRA